MKNKFKNIKKREFNAFTLAEVLITLGIIGVVAALTIPNLIAAYQEHAYLSAFKETYSMLSQAYLSARQENGTADKWVDATEAYTNLKPYLKITQECSSTCSGGDIKGLNGGAAYSTQGNYKWLLSNGATIRIFQEGTFLLVWVNTNGLKPPNQWGYDFFDFTLASKDGAPFLAWSRYAPSSPTSVGQNRTFCTKSYTGDDWTRGRSCVFWILRNGNMDYLHRDVTAAEWGSYP